MDPMPSFMPAASATTTRSARTPPSYAASNAGYSPLALACTAAGALLVGAGLTLSYLRPRIHQKDSPPAPAHLHDYWRSLSRRKHRPAPTASASASDSAPVLAPHAGKSEPVDLSALEFRVPVESDVDAVTEQTCDSFDKWNASVGLGPEFTSSAFARWVMDACIKYDQGLIAVRKSDGKVMGSVFVDEVDIVDGAVGCGPWSAAWGSLGAGVGRELVTRIVSQSLRHGAKSLRLVQIAANNASFALYASLGFEVREAVMAWKGNLRAEFIAAELEKGRAAGWSTREMTLADVSACDRLHQDCNGISRRTALTNDLQGGMSPHLHLALLDKRGRLSGYMTGLGPVDYALATTEEGMFFLMASVHAAYQAQPQVAAPPASVAAAAAPSANVATSGSIEPPNAPRVPYQHTCIRLYPSLTRWLLEGGMRAYRQVNLMCLGEWQPIQHDKFVYAPSIMF